MPLLEARNVVMRFGGVTAVAGVSFDVEAGQICGLIGPNGAGKTTLFNVVSGIYRPSGGEVRFAGQTITRMPRHRMATLGIGRTFQNLALFRSMTVRGNVIAGAHSGGRSGFLANALSLPSARAEGAAAAERTGELLSLLSLAPLADMRVADLPFGVQKRVEMARALACRPKLLLLDEPAGGLNHAEVDELAELLEQVRAGFDVTILLVEHHMGLVMRVSDKVVALNFGRKIADGPPDEVRASPEVLRAYLGDGQCAEAVHAA
ncbi:ABC transporter ATP-binding protein [Sabulicella rubraurantiaca]|uniref:ABC transporter ATP-binding protein n=1 Tax=Sabulicella rubraurantiaca TaxID=2811429 RepID=UPI001A96DBA0|nr:ABC transporter ATP-binding protein [Sabulicella rubraurantiaca]